jgi:hypothetical protein
MKLSHEIDWWVPFEEWVARRGRSRASFWYTQDWMNLERARVSRHILHQRHWQESCLVEFLTDLSDIADSPESSPPRRKHK